MGTDLNIRPARPLDIPSLTSLRGYLSLWVVLGHFWHKITELFPGAAVLTPFSEHGHSAVPAFFLLSGWVLSHNYADSFRSLSAGGVRRFLLLRLARIYPVHLATLLAVLGLVVVARLRDPAFSMDSYSLWSFGKNLLLVHGWFPSTLLTWNYPSWSISSEWFAYMLFPFACSWLLWKLDAPWKAIGAVWAFLVLAVLVLVCWPDLPLRPLALVTACFLAGAALHWVVRLPSVVPVPRWTPEVLLLAMVPVAFLSWFQVREATLMALSAGIIWALIRLQNRCTKAWWTSIPVTVLGNTSYSLYLSHAVTEKILAFVLPAERFAGAPLLVRCGVVLGWIAAVALGTALCFKLVEEPARKAIRKLAL